MANEPVGGEQNPGQQQQQQQQQPGAGDQNTQQQQQNAPGGGQQPVAGKKVFTYEEDRTDWVPRTRLNEHNPKFQQKLTEIERRALVAEQELERERKRTRALAGLETPSEDEQKETEVRALLEKMYPQLAAFKDLTPQQLQQVLNAGNAAEQAAVAQWERHSDTMISTLEDSVAKSLGVEKLNERQSKLLRKAYVEEAQAAVNARFVSDGRGGWVPKEGYDYSNDFMSRHERGDKQLLTEFAKAFVEDWFEPARRQATSAVTRRFGRPVPNGSRSGVPVTKTPEINYNDESAFKKALIDARRGGGNE